MKLKLFPIIDIVETCLLLLEPGNAPHFLVCRCKTALGIMGMLESESVIGCLPGGLCIFYHGCLMFMFTDTFIFKIVHFTSHVFVKTQISTWLNLTEVPAQAFLPTVGQLSLQAWHRYKMAHDQRKDTKYKIEKTHFTIEVMIKVMIKVRDAKYKIR